MLVKTIHLNKSFSPSYLFSFPLASLKGPKPATDERKGVLRRGSAAYHSCLLSPLSISKPGTKQVRKGRSFKWNEIRVWILILDRTLITKKRLLLPESKHKTKNLPENSRE